MIARNLLRFLQPLAVTLAFIWGAAPQLVAASNSPAAALPTALEKLPEDLRQDAKLRLDLEALYTAYGPAIRGLEAKGPKHLYLVMADGQKILYDDGRVKSFAEKLADPDLEDMLSQAYPLGKPTAAPPPDHDPGRIRVEPFFQALYGTPAQVKNSLVQVPFAGSRATFNANQGAAAALEKVGDSLRELLARNASLRSSIFPLGGTFNQRRIAGTNRLSAHSWGIAIDLHRGHYWRWGGILAPLELLALQSAFPQEIVSAFEAQGFIWGGKWFHYDTMHFEYRPEIIRKARLQAREVSK